MVAIGIDHNGIIAGKSERISWSVDVLVACYYFRLTERAYSSHDPNWLSVIPRLHIL